MIYNRIKIYLPDKTISEYFDIKEDDLFEWFTSLQTKLQKTKERWVGEELLVQSDEMRSFYPHAINTLRIYTLLGTDQVTRIMGAAVRWGNNGSHTDNIHNGGIAACVDVETGIVVSPDLFMSSVFE